MQKSSTLNLFCAISAATLLAACGGGGGSNSPSTSTSGTLGISLTDAPACGYDAVNITVNKVRVHQSTTASDTDSGWTDITLNPARKINLLNLTNGVLDKLGETPLTPGHYTQLRLVLDANSGNGLANSLILTGSTSETPLDTPSAVQSGIKLINEFDVAAGQRVDLVLDFDACKSIVKKGNSGSYGLKPVVKVVPAALNGISGFVATSLLGKHVTVSAEQNGSIIASTAPNASSGEFLLAHLSPGNYDVVITADDSATAVVASVPVAGTTSVTPLSTSGAPISLLAAGTPDRGISGTVTMTPASSEVAYVAAKQSFAAGPSVTVKYQGANLTTGTYALSLPVVAPQLAAYSATLPLVFVTKTDTTPGTGKYKMEASATGYSTGVIPSVNISATGQSGVNFSLIP